MSDLSIMDYFLAKTDDKNDFKTETDMDISSSYENSELMSSDFFDSILSLEKTNSDEYDLPSDLFENLDVDQNIGSDSSVIYDDMHCETSTFSDSGLSSDLQEIPDQILSDDEILKSILGPSESAQAEEIPVMPIKPVECVRPMVVTPVQSVEPEKSKIINIIKPMQKAKQVIRVQPLNGHSRSVLLPINIKDLKTIKIISASNLKAENIKLAPTPIKPVRKLTNNNNEKFIIKPTRKCENKSSPNDEAAAAAAATRRHISVSVSNTNDDEHNCGNEECDDDGNDSQYPLLLLTTEEKRLLNKDGIQLPCRYPLTKHEERELKRIRRKIRNKISAQDSRKRKKEYVDGLEERVKQCSEENRSLIKRIKILQMQNNKLSSQLSKLQALVFKTGTSRAHPATCLMIVLLSVMLITLPNLRNNGGLNSAGSGNDKELSTLQEYVARRALLFTQQTNNEDQSPLNGMDEFITFPASKQQQEQPPQTTIPNIESHDMKGVFNKTNKYEYDATDKEKLQLHDNIPIGVPAVKRYIEPDIDEYWPPAKKRNVSTMEMDIDLDMDRITRFNRTRTKYYE